MITFLFIILSSLQALNVEQINKIQSAYKTGKNIKAKDGMTFGYSLASIMGQESSWGRYVVGDKWENGKLKPLYDSSLGNFQVKLETAKITIKKFQHLKKKYSYLIYDGKIDYDKFAKYKSDYIYLKSITSDGFNSYLEAKASCLLNNKNYDKILYYESILNNPIWIKRYKAGEKRAIRTFKWAKKELKYHKTIHKNNIKKLTLKLKEKYPKDLVYLKEVKKQYIKMKRKVDKDVLIVNKLLSDFNFGAEIAGHYLLLCYEQAKKKHFKNPLKKAIGRYNGGWNNTQYYTKVKERMKVVKKIINNNLITLNK